MPAKSESSLSVNDNESLAHASPHHDLKAQADAALGEPDAVGSVERPVSHDRSKNGRFSKGVSGNPRGRPKRQKLGSETAQEMRDRIENEVIEVRVKGKMRRMTRREHMIRVAVAKLVEANPVQILKVLEGSGAKVGPAFKGGVLVVPGMASKAEWEATAGANQAKYRGNNGIDPEDL
jgi:hypothetical protein